MAHIPSVDPRVARIQAIADKHIAEYGLLEG
jgi:hypothetical protein